MSGVLPRVSWTKRKTLPFFPLFFLSVCGPRRRNMTNHFIRNKWTNQPACLHASCPCSHCTWVGSSKAGETYNTEAERNSQKLASESHTNWLLALKHRCKHSSSERLWGLAHRESRWQGVGSYFQCPLLLLTFQGLPTLAKIWHFWNSIKLFCLLISTVSVLEHLTKHLTFDFSAC